MQALLGAVPFAPARLLMVDPILPPWLPEVTLRRLRVGEAMVSLRFWRNANGKTEYEVLEKQGRLRVIRQPWLESFPTTIWDRVKDVAGSIRRS